MSLDDEHRSALGHGIDASAMRLRYVSVIALTLVGLAVLLPPETEVASVPAPVSRHVKPRGVSAAYLNQHMVDRLAAGGPLAIRWYAVDGVEKPSKEKPSEEDSALDVPANWCGTGEMEQRPLLEPLLAMVQWVWVEWIGETFSH